MDSIWNSKKQKVCRRMFQNTDSRLWKNLDWARRARVEPRLGIGSAYGVGETVPRGIVTGAGTYAEQPLAQTEQARKPQLIPLCSRAMNHLLEVVEQQFGATVVAVTYVW